MNYDEFIANKMPKAPIFGFEPLSEPHESLFEHQKDIARWMVRGGRRACFARFGLGKTRIHLQVAKWIIEREPTKKYMFVAPLGVRQEFISNDGPALGMDVRYCRNDEEVAACPTPFVITNYERVRDGGITINGDVFAGSGLDESSVLRSFGSKTYQTFLTLFESVKYRFVFTATPSPNKHKELIHYAGFLGVMDTGDALTRFFKRDSTQANNLTLYPHMEERFWLWMSSWAVFLQAPSDLGYSDEGYDLPPMQVHWHRIKVDHKKAWNMIDSWGQAQLFLDQSSGLKELSEVKRNTIANRISKVVEIIHDLTISSNCESRRDKTVYGELVSEEQRPSKYQESGVVFEEQREQQGEGQVVEETKSRKSGSASEGISREASRRDKPSKLPMVLPEQGQGESSVEIAKAEKFRADKIQSCGTSAKTERGVRHLQISEAEEKWTGESSHRPLSQNEQGARPSVRSMQFCIGDDAGQSRTPHQRSALSDQVIIWCDLNDEQKFINATFKKIGISFTSLTGSQDPDDRELLLEDWKSKKTSAFISKPSMYGAGVNLQQCHTMIFCGASYKFQDFIQACHRIHRFQQKSEVNIHVIYSESEDGVIKTLKHKWAQHNELVEKMTELLKKFKLSLKPTMQLIRDTGCQRTEVAGETFRMIHNDTIVELRDWPDNCVDEIVTSIPFGTLYEYSPNFSDLGHNPDNEAFFEQMDYLIPNLLRVLKPGRVACIHVKDRIRFGNVTGLGMPTIDRFSDKTADRFEKHGFAFMGRITIDTDVVRENNQTYRLGWTENSKDSTKMGVGMPEYVLLMRKLPSLSNAYADTPVPKNKKKYTRAAWQIDASSLYKSNGDRLPEPEILLNLPMDLIGRIWREHCGKNIHNHKEHVKIGLELEKIGKLPASFMLFPPVSNHPDIWTDIARMRVLNSEQGKRNEEKHVCPLQIDIVDRLINRYSSKGEIVFDPFAGIGTVPYRAIKMSRTGWGCELSEDYWTDAVGYCEVAEAEASVPTLFDWVKGADKAGVSV